MFNKVCIIGCGLIGSSIARGIKKNKLAIKVKIADLEDNYNIKQNKKKLSKLDKSKINKYNRAYKKLTGKKLTS